jgi:hypothetical protein
MKALLTLAIIGTAILLSGASADAAETFTIKQDKPKLTDVDVGGKGASHGDILAFEATFTVDNGTKGEIRGMVTTVDVPSGANDAHYDRVENIVLDFGGQDTLVAIGKSIYPGGAGEIVPDTPVVRAIAGGTGRYIGARGQISTSRREDGRYEHVVILGD